MARERVTMTIDGKLLKRLKRVVELEGSSVSAVMEGLVVGGLGDVEISAQARRDPVTEAVIAEMLRPENIARAARIVGETTDNPDLFSQRAAALVKRSEQSKQK
jgi:hypothetical protein